MTYRVVWFKRDLRVRDHAPLAEAMQFESAIGLLVIEPQWLPSIAGHLIKTQLLEPHWEKKAAEVVALERATLYGIVVYNNRRVNFGLVNPAEAREIFIREALVAGDWETRLPFVAANRKLIAQVEELEHKSRRQDVLVDDELIHAFYDQQLPAEVCSAAPSPFSQF